MEESRLRSGGKTHPGPPVLGGAPVSPAAMARAVVEKAARDSSAGRASLVTEVRSMVSAVCGVVVCFRCG